MAELKSKIVKYFLRNTPVGKPRINQMHKNASESNLLHGRTDNYPQIVNSSLINPYLIPNLSSPQFRLRL
jgi:hypothetical protein